MILLKVIFSHVYAKQERSRGSESQNISKQIIFLFGATFFLYTCEGGSRSNLNDAISFSKYLAFIVIQFTASEQDMREKKKKTLITRNLNISWFLSGRV